VQGSKLYNIDGQLGRSGRLQNSVKIVQHRRPIGTEWAVAKQR
jgi:hypothetical protein